MLKKNIDHQVKETYAIVATQDTLETDHITLLAIQQCQMH